MVRLRRCGDGAPVTREAARSRDDHIPRRARRLSRTIIWIGDGLRPDTGTADLLPLARLSVPTFIAMSPARPVSDVLLLILAPFERLTVPTFSTTSPPRPLLTVLVSMETLFRVNAVRRDVSPGRHLPSAPGSRCDSRRRYRPSRHRWSHSLPPAVDVQSTGLDHGPIRQTDRLGMHRNVARTSPAEGIGDDAGTKSLKGRQNPPCFPLPTVLAP